tara:strand:+ start:1170 stop:2405 length:1236 start_codon:yes stop_codon:yes gene_type:complete
MEYNANTIVSEPYRADAGQYFSIAFNIVNHGVVSVARPDAKTPTPDSYRGPGYPLLVALVIATGGEDNFYRNLLFMQAVVGALSVAVTIAIARYWMGMGFAIAAGALMAIWPHTVTLAGYILTETFFGFSLLVGIYLLCRAHSTQKWLGYTFAGFTFSYAALINPVILIFPVLTAGVLLFSQRRNALIFLLCALVIPLAWSLRGVMLEESGRSSSSRLVDNVFTGMEPDFDYGQTPEIIAARKRINEGQAAFNHSPMLAIELITKRIAEQPVFYVKWYLWQKPLRYWQWSIIHGDGDIYVYPVLQSPFYTSTTFRAISSLCYALNLPLLLAAVGFVLIFANKALRRNVQDNDFPLLLVTLLFIYATVLHSALTPEPRYAVPFKAFEVLLAMSLLAAVHRKWRDSKREEINK